MQRGMTGKKLRNMTKEKLEKSRKKLCLLYIVEKILNIVRWGKIKLVKNL